jgi:4-hydroxybenzoate polyprenyltransferase
MDGALVRTDPVVESLMLLAKRRPWRLVPVLTALAGGMARFRERLACEMLPDVAPLPFNQALLRFLTRQRAAGRRLVLASGADIRVAEAVAAHTGLFDRVISTGGTGGSRAHLRRDRLVAEFGRKKFDYAGIDGRDDPVLAAARRVILVGTSAGRATRRADTLEVEATIPDAGAGFAAYWRALRPGQWIKNLLVFLPLLTLDPTFTPILLLNGFVAAAAFSLCASSGYLFNDLLDMPRDRRHPVKRNRPIANGEVSLGVVLASAPVLFLAGVAVGMLLPPVFVGLLCIYYALTLCYSLRLKDIVVLDVVTLAFLYTLRVAAGAVAFGLTAPVWLLAFSLFLFLSLGLAKRSAELEVMQQVEGARAHARAYLLQDRELLTGIGAASGYAAALLLILFENSGGGASGSVEKDPADWALSLLFIYWISYVWLMAHRGRMGDDPVSFTIRDPTSRVLILLACAALAIRWLVWV